MVQASVLMDVKNISAKIVEGSHFVSILTRGAGAKCAMGREFVNTVESDGVARNVETINVALCYV